MEKALANDPAIVSKLSALNLYDYVIVGSGIGGGILAEDLVKKNKRVLLIEKGGLTFSTHVCNTARPDYSRGTADAPEGNELVYAALKAQVQTAEGSEPYVGGPMHCLGGRSNVWGLWTPRADDVTLNEYFPASINEYLKNGGYDEVFNLLTNDSQKDVIYPTNELGAEVLDNARTALNKAVSDYIVPGQDLHLGPIATQLISPEPYRFPQGAYSTTGPLLNRMYARDQNLTVLLETEVLEIEFPKKTDTSRESVVVNSLTIRSTTTGEVNHILTEHAKVILSAGTLNTAKIALTSGLQLHNPLVGKGLIDHEVWASRVAQERPKNPDPSTSREPILLQANVKVDNRRALLSVTYNSNFFLAGSTRLSIRQYWDTEGRNLLGLREGAAKIQEDDFDTVAVLLEFHAELEDENEVLNIPSKDPVIRIKRRDAHIDEHFQLIMQDLGTKVRDSTLDLRKPERDGSVMAPRLSLLGLGVFAHEVGTMRMDGPKTNGKGVVDENLQVKGFSNLFICDLSVFPVSTPANPTRTLAALSLRLSKFLEPNVEPNVDSEV